MLPSNQSLLILVWIIKSARLLVYILKIDLYTGQYHGLREVLRVNISCTVVRTLKSLEDL